MLGAREWFPADSAECWVQTLPPISALQPIGKADNLETYALVTHLKEGLRPLFFPERIKTLEALLMAPDYEEYTMFLIDSEANNSDSHKAVLSSKGAGICEDRFFPGKQPTWQESWLAHHHVSEAACVSLKYVPDV